MSFMDTICEMEDEKSDHACSDGSWGHPNDRVYHNDCPYCMEVKTGDVEYAWAYIENTSIGRNWY